MRQLWLLLSLALVCAVAAACPVPTASAAAVGDRMMDAINESRSAAGVRSLKRSRRLIRSSASRAELMMRADVFAHPSRLRVPTFDRVGEVLELHAGHRPRVERTLRRWMASAGHRQLLLERAFGWIGAARAEGRFGGTRATIWVVRFGRK